MADAMAARVRSGIRTLDPGYFALVMATGVVSIAMRDQHSDGVSVGLLWISVVAYVVLVGAYAWRWVAFRDAVAADLFDPSRTFSYFTFIAATDVLGARIALDRHRAAGLILLLVGTASWLVLGYALPWAAELRESAVQLLQHANGTWFNWVVASQSIAVLAATLEPMVHTGGDALALLAVFAWSVGLVLYAIVGLVVAARLLLYDVRPIDFAPPYWVSMGATAITVLAGATLLGMTNTHLTVAIGSAVSGISTVFWAFGTWLIPALVAAEVWRHGVRRVPLRYEPALWTVVFPLGMYSVAGVALGRALDVWLVEDIGSVMAWVALAAWTLTAVAMARHLGRAWFRPTTPPL